MRNLCSTVTSKCLTITSKRKLIFLACATAALPASAAPSLQAQLQTLQAQMVQMQADMHYLKTQNQALKSQVAPVGSVMAFAQGTVPDGWLECDGRTLDKDEENHKYLPLFTAIRHTYSPDHASDDPKFNLPDLRGEFLRGWSNGREGVDAERELGSAQIGTNVLVDDDGGQTVGVINYTDNNLKDLGYEPASKEVVSINMNNAGKHDVIGQGRLLRTTRPRNVAMIYAIKY